MAVTVRGAVLDGVEARAVEVEVDLLRRLPAMVIVGMAQGAVRESSERVRSAVESSGLTFPRKRIVVNLAPASLRKQGTSLDLATAVGILAADGQVPTDPARGVVCAGELALGGRLRPVRGALSMARLARALGLPLLLPRDVAAQAAMVPDVEVVGVRDLAEAVAWLRGELEVPRPSVAPPATGTGPRFDLADVRGQTEARRALAAAAAGAHHLFMMGPPGCGKSMLARRLPSILPPMGFDEALEATTVHAAAGLLDGTEGLLAERPFRAPHHTVSGAGLIGDRTLRPGELPLAHQGVLFLDEAPEFSRHVLEMLRQPLEEKEVRLTRAAGQVTMPAAVTLVLAANPCPCARPAACGCTLVDRQRYLRKLSGALLDRIDLHLPMTAVSAEALLFGSPGESSADVRARVVAARARQHHRGQRVPNGQLGDAETRAFVALGATARRDLADWATHKKLSARATTRLLRVARTLADLDDAAHVSADHIKSAAHLRPDLS